YNAIVGFSVRMPRAAPLRADCSLFFFKQKTAYEIGLGIPAEPLFRSQELEALKPAIEACGISTLSQSPMLGFHKQMDNRIKLLRSEERRVGKECRSRWSPYH